MVVVDDSPRRRTMKVVNHEEFKNFLAYVWRHFLRVVEVGENLDILLIQVKLQHEHSSLMDKECSRGRCKKNVAVTYRVVKFFNRKRDIVSEMWSNYVNEERLLVAPPAGNYEDTSTRVPGARVVASFIQYFVRKWCHIRHRTVTKDLMDLLEGMVLLKIDHDC